jgi:hypothetical protein
MELFVVKNRSHEVLGKFEEKRKAREFRNDLLKKEGIPADKIQELLTSGKAPFFISEGVDHHKKCGFWKINPYMKG